MGKQYLVAGILAGAIVLAESPPVVESLAAPEWVQWADEQYDVAGIVEPPCLEPVGISAVWGCAMYHPHGRECWHYEGSKIWHVWDEAAGEYRKEYQP